MSYSLALENGDLVPRGNQLKVVYGVDKLTQDLKLWLTESLGGDIMHPELGTMLDAWIGSRITFSTKAEVHAEVLRVLDNYQRVQVRGVKTRPQKYSISEILWEINDIKIDINFDTISVLISVSTPPPQSRTAQIIVTTSANA